MSLSIATKIFLGFAVVIIAFGAAEAFTLSRTSELRQTVTVLWKELTPMSNQLRGLSRQLKSAEEFVGLKRPNDAQWLQQVLPALEPFDGSSGFLTLADRLDALATSDALEAPDRDDLAAIAASFRAFSRGPALAELLANEGPPDVVLHTDGADDSSAAIFSRLVARTLRITAQSGLTATAPEARATARTLRRINREVNDAVRALSGPIRAIDLRTEENEQSSRLLAVTIAGAALVISVAMLVIALFTLRPLRKLGAGARRIAAGDYAERVDVSSSDELGQLAEEFNRMASSLEERDRALADKQRELVVAERLAAVGRLAAQITHEVRNPLSSISLNTELLVDELDDLARALSSGPSGASGHDTTHAQAMLASIASEVQRLKDITEQYLQLTRFSRAAPPEEPASYEAPGSDLPLAPPDVSLPSLTPRERTPTDLVALVRSFVAFLGPEAAQSGVNLQVADAPTTVVRVDPDQIRQALLNVARNALDSLRGRPERGTVTFAIRRSDLPQGHIELRVSDDGPGFPEEVRDRLFLPFVTSKPHGTGLGLAVTRDILRAHGGDVVITSPLGPEGGTAVDLLIPSTQA